MSFGDSLEPGQWLNPGNSIFSQDGATEFKLEEDGTLAVYINQERRWTNTSESRGDIRGVTMQTDGNLVVYTHNEEAVWASGTGDQYTWLRVQNDGNVVLYKPTWATNTS